MQTRKALVHMLDGSTAKLHYRPLQPGVLGMHIGYDDSKCEADVETAKTTLGVKMARVTKNQMHKVSYFPPSPWFEVKDFERDTIEQFCRWWTSGAAISNLMLR